MADIVYVERILIGRVNQISVQGIVKISDKLLGKIPSARVRGIVEIG